MKLEEYQKVQLVVVEGVYWLLNFNRMDSKGLPFRQKQTTRKSAYKSFYKTVGQYL